MSAHPQDRSTGDGLLRRLDGGVMTLAFSGADLTPMMAEALRGALEELTADEAVRIVLIDGSAGLGGEIAASLCGDLVQRIRALPQPVIGKLRGTWSGSALALVAACDIVHVADDAQFRIDTGEEADFLAAPAGAALSGVMTRRAVSRHALDGRPFDGVEAGRNGLATLSFEPAALDGETERLLTNLLEKDPLALRFTKQTLRHVAGMSWDAVLDYNAAKSAEFKSLQAGRPSTRAAAVESFLAGTSKPGLGS